MTNISAQLTPVQQLVLAYAARARRGRWQLVMALDNRFRDIMVRPEEPLLVQIKLAWWRDIFASDSSEWPLGEPILATLREREASGACLADLLALTDAWEALLLVDPADEAARLAALAARGDAFFRAAVGGESAALLSIWCALWSAWDFLAAPAARHWPQELWPSIAARHHDLTMPPRQHMDRAARLLCHLVRRDLGQNAPAQNIYRPTTAALLCYYGLTGR